jgi:hypothetical protein
MQNHRGAKIRGRCNGPMKCGEWDKTAVLGTKKLFLFVFNTKRISDNRGYQIALCSYAAMIASLLSQ